MPRSLLRSPAVRQAAGKYFPAMLEKPLAQVGRFDDKCIAQAEITQLHRLHQKILCYSFGNHRRE